MSSKSVLITGATGKIGLVFVEHFLSRGYQVIASGRSLATLEPLKESLASSTSQLHLLPVDLSLADGTYRLLDELRHQCLAPRYIINNARNSSYLSVQKNGVVSRSNFLSEIELDVVAPYELTVLLADDPCFELSSVVNIGSQYGVVVPNLSLYDKPSFESPLHYGVAKSALSHLTKELAVRLAIKNIRVNCVAFGGVEGRVDESFKRRYADLCPMQRMLKESELAAPVEFLLSSAASAITGHTLVADCGWSLW